ncbi:hypothetical protein HPP92_015009 [Vanilla planifolia]|uniref:Uncharacterized protein n=1 Tax=Vanilla planifolia TaxID=51239 RepID=A0A835QVM7_VANPL|nr:hypothetical protein HPP92_015009 [Vanilla planifolia]
MQSAEDQTRCWMWAARRKLLASFLLPSSSTPAFETWEEQAFARDSAAGDLVGYAWPPRSLLLQLLPEGIPIGSSLGRPYERPPPRPSEAQASVEPRS